MGSPCEWEADVKPEKTLLSAPAQGRSECGAALCMAQL